ILRVHRQAGAARGGIARIAQDQRPGLAAIGGAVDAALLAVAPELAGDAGVDEVGILRVYDHAGDAFGLGHAHVLPGLAAVGGLVDAVADRDGVARPGFAGAHPDGARIARVDGDGSDRLHGLLVEDGFEGRPTVVRLPHAAARRADVDGGLPVLGAGGHRRDAAAHRRRADVARSQAR